ncbi:MAG: GAF domain-containing protein, partial [Candidatus Heimdallarchaeota archaeon]|nr:GAF domain-containing protein [Candidatus Heimdallarchaeota archaeon]
MEENLLNYPVQIGDKLDFKEFQALFELGKNRLDGMVEDFCKQFPRVLNASGAAFYVLDVDNGVFSPWFDDERQVEIARENIKIANPIIKEALKSRKQVTLGTSEIESTSKAFMEKFNAQNLLLHPAMIGEDAYCLILVWKNTDHEQFNDNQLKYITSGVNKFQLLVNEVVNSTYLHDQVEEFSLIQKALMDLTNASTLDLAMKSYISSLENLFDDFSGAQIYLYSNNKLMYSAGRWEGEWHENEYSPPEPGGANITVVKTGKMKVIPDIQEYSKGSIGEFGHSGSLIIVPLFTHNRTVGVVNIRLNQVGDIPADKIRLVNLLADQAAISIEREMDHEQIKVRATELEVLLQASFALTSTKELDDIKNIVVENALSLSPEALNAFLFLYDGDGLDFGAAKWNGIQKDVNDFKPRNNGLTFKVAKSGERIIIEDVTQHKLFNSGHYVKEGWKGAIVGIPLKHGEQVVGVLTLAFKIPQNFNPGTI